MTLSLCVPYYNNPQMLAEQYRVWAGYPDALKRQIEIVLVDDGSQESPAVLVEQPSGLPPVRLYRVLEDRPWHQHAARNLAASQAVGPWLLLTDIDHVLPMDALRRLLGHLERGGDQVYTFARLQAPEMRVKVNKRGRPHAHVNSFAVRKSRYWSVGGYDEDLVGYGTDWYFRTRLDAVSTVTLLPDVTLIRYPAHAIADAVTPGRDGLTAKQYRKASMQFDRNNAIVAHKIRTSAPPTVLNFPWERVA